MSRDTDNPRYWAWTLAAVVAGGAALRLAGIGAESVDLEEYACIGALHTRGLHHFLVEQRALYPFGAPLVPLFYYLWSGLFGEGIVAVRLLSALAGTGMILLLPLLAREIWPDAPRTARTAGLIAALCAALSPVHLFQAQEARMYAFVALFAALSGLSLLRAARTGGARWWALNLAANAALVWSHYFAVFLWPVQALWLLRARGVRWRTRVMWVAALALLLVPVAGWISGIAPQPKELHDYYTMPEPVLVARNLVAGDAVYWSSSAYFPSDRAWCFAPGPVRRALVAAHPAGDMFIAGAFFIALLWGGFQVLRRRGEERGSTGYLLLWALAPLLLLAALSFAWKPVYASRYLTHASLALYLLLGGLMASIPARARRFCVVLLAGAYAWQLSLALPPQTRTAWKQTGRMIEAADGAGAIALVQGVFWKPIFDINLAGKDCTVAAVLEPEAMAELAAFLAKAIPSLEPGATPACWVVLVDAIHGQTGRLESAVAPFRLHWARHDFPGERRLSVYRLSPEPGAVREQAAPAPAALLALAQTIADHASAPDIAGFQDAVRTRPDKEGGGYLRLGVELAQKGRVSLAAAVLDEALALWPAHLVDLALLERRLSGGADFAPLVDRALERVKSVPERTPALRQILQSLLEQKEMDALRDACHRMIAAFPEYPEGYAYLGKLDYDGQQLAAALPNLERAVALRAEQPAFIYTALGDSLNDAGRCAEALRMLEQGLPFEPQNGALVVRLADRHVDCGDPERALALATAQLEREPQSRELRRSRAEALVLTGRWEEAEGEVELLLPDGAGDTVLTLMAWRVYSAREHDGKARALLERIAGGGTDPGAMIAKFAEALYVRRDRSAVLETLGKIAGKEPLPEDLQRTLDRLCPPAQPPAAAGSSS